MTLRFCDSFDHYVTADLLGKWTTVSGATIVAATGRNGTAGLYLANRGQYVRKTFGPQTTWIFGAAVRYTSTSYNVPIKLFTCLDGTAAQVDLRILGNGTLQITRDSNVLGTSALGMTSDQQYYVEFKATIGNAGTAVAMVNGDTWLSISGDTQATGNTTADTLRVGGVVSLLGETPPCYIDDLYICDGQGAGPDNDFLGDCRVEYLAPDGAGASTDWTPSAGANYECVDEAAPDSDTTYVSADTAAQKDLYALTNLTTSAGTIYGVQSILFARKDDAGVRTVKSAVATGGSESNGADTNLSDTYAYTSDIFTAKPGGGAWTVGDVNSSSIGAELVA